MNTDTSMRNLNQLILILRWPVIIAIGIWILVVELLEHREVLTRWDPTFLSEVIILEGILILVGVAIGWLVKIIHDKNSILRILKAKDELSQQLTTARDWDQITTLLVEYPRTLLPLKAASLLTYSQKNKQFELTAYWTSDVGFSAQVPVPQRCSQCVFTQPFKLRPVEVLCSKPDEVVTMENDYCLPLSYGDAMQAMLQLRLPRDTKPTREQVEMLNNLGPEMAISLRGAQENYIREKMAADKAAEEVRQGITRDMHDTLAQNLAFMQLKLDQMMKQNTQPGTQEHQQNQQNLHKLREVADESYQLVRSTLGALHPTNSRRLGEILAQHAYAIADRTDLEIRFNQEGQPQLVDPLVIHHVLQLYREALSNVSKHADANLVSTRLVWMKGGFKLEINDDGRGLEPQSMQADGHYGLRFMAERVEELNGELSINSVPGEGTSFTILIPLPSNGEVTRTSVVK